MFGDPADLAGSRFRYSGGWISDESILAHWRQGKNTRDIARHFFVPEAEVANRLPNILEMDARRRRVRENING